MLRIRFFFPSEGWLLKDSYFLYRLQVVNRPRLVANAGRGKMKRSIIIRTEVSSIICWFYSTYVLKIYNYELEISFSFKSL